MRRNERDETRIEKERDGRRMTRPAPRAAETSRRAKREYGLLNETPGETRDETGQDEPDKVKHRGTTSETEGRAAGRDEVANRQRIDEQDDEQDGTRSEPQRIPTRRLTRRASETRDETSEKAIRPTANGMSQRNELTKTAHNARLQPIRGNQTDREDEPRDEPPNHAADPEAYRSTPRTTIRRRRGRRRYKPRRYG